MKRLRRLLTGVLTIAMAQFGVLASAPAHSHEHEHAPQALHVVIGDAAADIDADHEHHGSAGGALHHRPVDQVPADDGADGAEPVTHVHQFSQFAPVSNDGPAAPVFASVALSPPFAEVSPAARAAAPPLRPPRIL